jgi:hypothetical protein
MINKFFMYSSDIHKLCVARKLTENIAKMGLDYEEFYSAEEKERFANFEKWMLDKYFHVNSQIIAQATSYYEFSGLV